MKITCVFDGYDKTKPLDPLDYAHVEYTLDNVKFFGEGLDKAIEQSKEKRKIWLEANKESVKLSVRKCHDKRRKEMGSELINNWFEGCEMHHVNKKQIICIPAEPHIHTYHNHNKPKTMIEINRIAFSYLSSTIRQL